MNFRKNSLLLLLLGKWYRRGEHQPEVGVLLLTQGVDGDQDTTGP
jgi:hypothetical protein